ncbi:DUF1990 family protein [Lysinibacter sp. HNR]|uniref:DUF1990 family protein n=1 Tax=Lysinibacter sp. HNR TaxID=3031408 RepID=UPI0024356C0B|nr:DUF1990 family protein [Lysinibacter sp. HNR]WGD36401.1 DUF1990 family protein [Lysinibacter sp. HNR]
MIKRQSTPDEPPISYGAIGASRDPNLMRFPPRGSTPSEFAVKLGSGTERFRLASARLMTWGAQRGAGFDVHSIHEGTGSHYTGLEFDENGIPFADYHGDEQLFSEEGEEFITPGISATLVRGSVSREVRVVFVVNETNRVGFAYGTLDARGPVGEEFYMVEQRENDTVWAVYRGFHEVVQSRWKKPLRAAEIRSVQDRAREQLRALLPTQTVVSAARRVE